MAATASALERLTPERRLSLDGKTVAPELTAKIARIVVELADDAFNQATIYLNDPDMSLISGETFAAGMGLGVELGYMGKTKLVFDGEIVSLEPRFSRDKPPGLVVRALERLHRLALAPRTRSFHDADVKQIANKIAHEHGLSSDAPAGMKGHLLQPNISDFALLRKIAARNGHHLYQSGKKLVIGPPPSLGEMSFTPGEGLKRLKVKLRATEQVPKVVVRGWDPKTKKEIVGQAEPSGEAAEGKTAANPFGRTDFFVEGVHVHDTNDANAVAKALVSRIAERFAIAEGEILGDADLMPGKVVNFDKLGELLDGKYRITLARHEFDRKGYRTVFEGTRVAKKKAAVKFKAGPTQTAAAKKAQEAEKKQKKELEEQKCTIEFGLKAGDKGMSGVKVTVEIHGGGTQEQTTDGSGGVKIPEMPKNALYSLTFGLEDAPAEWRVEDPDGKAIEGIKARFEPVAPVFNPNPRPNAPKAQDVEGSNGDFKVEGTQQNDAFDVILKGTSQAEFQIQDHKGKPQTGLVATVKLEGGRQIPVHDKNGTFTVPDLLEGEYYEIISVTQLKKS